MLARKMIIGMVTILLVSIGGAAWGTTYYVDPNGNDACDCSSWGNACATIQKGIDVAGAGDIVEVTGTQQELIRPAWFDKLSWAWRLL